MTQKYHIVFFGNEKLATGLVATKPIIKDTLTSAGFDIEQVVTGPLSDLRPHTAQLAVLAAYGHIIPQRVLDEFPLGIINIHPSLLPHYRGPTPIETAMLDGAEKTGVSIMRLTAGMDEGPIYKQKTFHLSKKEIKAELTEALQTLGAELLIEVLPGIADGFLKPRSQPHIDRDMSYCKKISKEDGIIDWNKPAERLEREIRAYAGWPQSRTTLGNVEVIITAAHAVPSNFSDTPGDIEVVQNIGILMVNCGSGYLCIDTLKPTGKKEMPIKAFLAGYRNRL